MARLRMLPASTYLRCSRSSLSAAAISDLSPSDGTVELGVERLVHLDKGVICIGLELADRGDHRSLLIRRRREWTRQTRGARQSPPGVAPCRPRLSRSRCEQPPRLLTVVGYLLDDEIRPDSSQTPPAAVSTPATTLIADPLASRPVASPARRQEGRKATRRQRPRSRPQHTSPPRPASACRTRSADRDPT